MSTCSYCLKRRIAVLLSVVMILETMMIQTVPVEAAVLGLNEITDPVNKTDFLSETDIPEVDNIEDIEAIIRPNNASENGKKETFASENGKKETFTSENEEKETFASENEEKEPFVSENEVKEPFISENEVQENLISENEVQPNQISDNSVALSQISQNIVSANELSDAQKRFNELISHIDKDADSCINIPQAELDKRDEITKRQNENQDKTARVNETSGAEADQALDLHIDDTAALTKTQIDSNAVLDNQRTDQAYLDYYTTPIYEEGSVNYELIRVTAQMILESYISDNQLTVTTEELAAREKVKAAHDWICKHVYYDMSAVGDGQAAHQVLASVSKDPLYGTDGYEPRMLAVCEGFANLNEAILHEYGIPCINVSGMGYEPENDEEYWTKMSDHAWNHVYLTDENGSNGRWYLIDTTWDTYNRANLDGETVNYNKDVTNYKYYLLSSYPEDHFVLEPDWLTNDIPKAFEPQIDYDGVCRIPEGIKYLENYALDNIKEVKRLELPDSLLVMGKSSIILPNLESIDFPENMLVFDNFTIQADDLKSITMNGQRNYMGSRFEVSDNAVYGGESSHEALILAVGPEDGSEFRISDTTQYLLCNSIQGSRITSLIIPDSVISMDYRTIQTEKLEKITIGCGLRRVFQPLYLREPSAWILQEPSTWVTNSKLIQEINISEENPIYASVDGIVYNKAKTKLLYIPNRYQREIAVVEETVTNLTDSVCTNDEQIVAFGDGITDTLLSEYKNNSFGGICAYPGSTLEQYAARKGIPYYELPYVKTDEQTYYYLPGEEAEEINVVVAGYSLNYRWVKSDTPNIEDASTIIGADTFSYQPSTDVGGTYYLWLQVSNTADFASNVMNSGMYTIHVTDVAKTYLEHYNFYMQESSIKDETSIEQYINRVLATVAVDDGKTLKPVKLSYEPLTSATTDSYEAMQGAIGQYCFKVQILEAGEVVDETGELCVNLIPKKLYLEISSFGYSSYYVEIGKPITCDGLYSIAVTFSDGTSKILDDDPEKYGILPCVITEDGYIYGDAIKQAKEEFIGLKRGIRYLTQFGYVYKTVGTINKIESDLAFKDVKVTVGESVTESFLFSGTVNSCIKVAGTLPEGLNVKVNSTKTGVELTGTPVTGQSGNYYFTGTALVVDLENQTGVQKGFSIDIDCSNPEYTITYVLNGSKNHAENPSIYTYDTKPLYLKNPTMENEECSDYKFFGWYTDESFSTESRMISIDRTAKKNLTLYAKWLPPYRVTYYLNEGSVSENLPEYVGKSFGTIKLPIPTRENYKFLGWYRGYNESTGNYTIPIEYLDCTTLTGNISLYARWGKKCTITYELGGGINADGNLEYFYLNDEPFTLLNPTLNDPSREGYEFAGWYTDDTFQKPVEVLSFEKEENITLYAKWRAPKSIRWELNGGSYNGEMPLIFNQSTQALTLGTPTKENEKFKGWYRDYDEGTGVFSNPVTSIDFSEEEEDITLYAKWAKKYQITYHMDGGTNHSDNPEEFYVDDPEFILKNPTLNDSSREGYEFMGWYLEQAYTTRVSTLDFTKGENLDVYAKWAPPHIITWELDGGEYAGEMPEYYHAAMQPLTLGTPTKADYKFGGWFRTYHAVTKEFSDPVTILDFTQEEEDITLYARWLTKRRIRYELDKGSNAEDNPRYFYLGDPDFTLLEPTLADSFREGYVFGGWYKDKEFTQRITKLVFDRDEDITLYVKWVPSHAITWELNGGDYAGSMPLFYSSETPTLILSEPTKNNARFAGWYRSYDSVKKEFYNQVTQLDFTAETEDITLYAKWQGLHSINYYLDGGINAPENPDSFYVGDDDFVLLPPTLNDPLREDYVFGGWFEDAEFTQEAGILKFQEEKDLERYAKWTKNKVSLSEVPYAWMAGDHIYVNWNNGKTKNETITLVLPQDSYYKVSGSTCVKALNGNTLKIQSKGVATVMVSTPGYGAENQELTISVIECMPRTDQTAVTLNKQMNLPVDFTVYASHALSLFSTKGMFYQSTEENAAVAAGLHYESDAENGNSESYRYRIYADEDTKAGTYTVYMKYQMADGSIQMPQSSVYLPLKVTVVDKLPKTTAKITKMNAFYTDERAKGTITLKCNEPLTVLDMELEAATGAKVPSKETLAQWYTLRNSQDGWELCVNPEAVNEATKLSEIPKKARIMIHTTEYGTIYSANVTIPVSMTAPKVTATKTKFVMTQYLGDHLSDSFRVSEKIGTLSTPIRISGAYVENVTKNEETPGISYTDDQVTFTLNQASNYKKLKKVKVYVRDYNWTKSVAVPISIQTTEAKPEGKLSKSAMNLDLYYRRTEDSMSLVYNQAAEQEIILPETLLPTSKYNEGAQPLVTITKLADSSYEIHAQNTETTAVGTYRYKLVPTVQKGDETVALKALSFTVKVTRNKKAADVSLALQKGSKIERTDLDTFGYQWKPKLLNIKGIVTNVSFETINPDFKLSADLTQSNMGGVVESFDIHLVNPTLKNGTYRIPIRFGVQQMDGISGTVVKTVTIKVAEQSAKVNLSKNSETLYLSVLNQKKNIQFTPVSNPQAQFSTMTAEVPTAAAGLSAVCSPIEQTVTLKIVNPDSLTANKTYKIKVNYQFAGGTKKYTKTISVKIKE